ncbi:MAG: diacylglycerol kinase family lipid kinase [Nibricoccus sp.]
MIKDHKSCFIFNPRSGHNARNPYLLTRARDFIKEHKLNAYVVATEQPRHASDLARDAIDQGCGIVVAIGGDGTMNEVASALVGTPTLLGLVPCGSGNGLGRHLGIPGPGRGAFRTLLQGKPRAIDTGVANGFPFFNAMGLGFDAEISDRFNKLVRRGFEAYARTAIGAFSRFKPQVCTIRSGNESFQTSAFIISIANSDQYGNDCFIAPGASVDDGKLDITVLKKVDLFNAVPIALRLFTRTIDGSQNVKRLKGSQFEIERPSPGLIHTDGETHQTDAKINVFVRPQSLRLLVPAAKNRTR